MPGPGRGLTRASTLRDELKFEDSHLQKTQSQATALRPAIVGKADIAEVREGQALQRRFGGKALPPAPQAASRRHLTFASPSALAAYGSTREMSPWSAALTGIANFFKPAVEFLGDLYARWKVGIPGPFLLMGASFLMSDSPSLTQPHPQDVVTPLPKSGQPSKKILLVLEEPGEGPAPIKFELHLETVYDPILRHDWNRIRFSLPGGNRFPSGEIQLAALQALKLYSQDNGEWRTFPTFESRQVSVGATLVIGDPPRNLNRHNFDPKKTKVFRIEERPDEFGVRQRVLVEIAPQALAQKMGKIEDSLIPNYIGKKLQIDPNLLRQEFGDWFQKWSLLFEAAGWNQKQAYDLLKLGMEETGKDFGGRPPLPDFLKWLEKRMALLEDIGSQPSWPAGASYSLAMTQDLRLPDYKLPYAPISELRNMGYSPQEITHWVRTQSALYGEWWGLFKDLQGYMKTDLTPEEAMGIFLRLGEDATKITALGFLRHQWSWEINAIYDLVLKTPFKKTRPDMMMNDISRIIGRLADAGISVERQFAFMKAVVTSQNRTDQLAKELDLLLQGLKSGILELFPGEAVIAAMTKSYSAGPKKPKP